MNFLEKIDNSKKIIFSSDDLNEITFHLKNIEELNKIAKETLSSVNIILRVFTYLNDIFMPMNVKY